MQQSATDRAVTGSRISARARPRPLTRWPAASHIHLQRGDEGFLRDVDFAELAHALFAFLLLLQKFSFARHVTAVAFCRHVLAERAHGLAGDDLAADGGLD